MLVLVEMARSRAHTGGRGEFLLDDFCALADWEDHTAALAVYKEVLEDLLLPPHDMEPLQDRGPL